VPNHGQDPRLPSALELSRFARALQGVELGRALADCNRGLRLAPDNPQILDSRGLVRLRQGDYRQAIADFDAALAREPKIAWSLYGRGVAQLRQHVPSGQSDIDAAVALNPEIEATARRHGLTP
jgi:tetratricopeptide (TPR) repeat protein